MEDVVRRWGLATVTSAVSKAFRDHETFRTAALRSDPCSLGHDLPEAAREAAAVAGPVYAPCLTCGKLVKIGG